jgi:hypothetical protein
MVALPCDEAVRSRSSAELAAERRDGSGTNSTAAACPHATNLPIAARACVTSEGAPARNHGAIAVSKIRHPKAELGMNGQMGFPHR